MNPAHHQYADSLHALASTGSNSLDLLIVGLAILMFGVGLAWAAKRA